MLRAQVFRVGVHGSRDNSSGPGSSQLSMAFFAAFPLCGPKVVEFFDGSKKSLLAAFLVTPSPCMWFKGLSF